MSNKNKPARQSVWETFTYEVTDFNQSHGQKNGLLGYISVYIEDLGMAIRNFGIFFSHNQFSVSLPSIPPNDSNGNMWYPIIDIYDKRDLRILQKKILEAFKEQCRHNGISIDLGSGILAM